jgi:PPOX class probable F420-dependent enzyme
VSVDDLPAGVALPEYAKVLLEGKPVAFMTTMRPDGHMSTNPVAVVYDGVHIQVSTLSSRRKYRNLLHDDRVTVCIIQPDNLNRYVEVRGRAVIQPDPDRSFIDGIARRYMGVDTYPFDLPGDERARITVIAEQVSCPRIPLGDDPPYRQP